MPAITSLDLSNAKLDVDHIAAIATSLQPTATDRLGHTKDTISGAVYKIAAFTNKGVWSASTSYQVKDLVSVTVSSVITWYVCVVQHTSSATFSSDSSSKWRVYQGVTTGDLSADSGSALVGNGGETVAQSFDAMQMASFSALRAYSGTRKAVRICSLLTGGAFTAAPLDTISPDDNAMVIVDANGMRWKRQYNGFVQAEWFGVVPGGVVDCFTPLTNFYAYVCKQADFGAGFGGELPAGKLKTTDTIVVNISNGSVAPNIKTAGSDQTIIVGDLANKPLMTVKGGSGRFGQARWDGIGFDQTALATGKEGVRVDGASGIVWEDCQFRNMDIGVRFYNLSDGHFTEGIVFERPQFANSVNAWARYSVGAGTNSFRSSGFKNFVANCNTNTARIIIDDGAYCYLCPMSGTFWTTGPTTIFFNSNTAIPGINATFIGDITTESSQFLFGGGTGKIYLDGDLLNNGLPTAYNPQIQLGTVFLCRNSIQAANGSFIVQRKPWRIASPIGSAGAPITINAVSNGIDNTSNHIIFYVSVTSSNYQYDIEIHVLRIAGFTTLVAKNVNDGVYNGAGYGVPVLTAVYPNVILTNALWPTATAYTVTTMQENALYQQ